MVTLCSPSSQVTEVMFAQSVRVLFVIPESVEYQQESKVELITV